MKTEQWVDVYGIIYIVLNLNYPENIGGCFRFASFSVILVRCLCCVVVWFFCCWRLVSLLIFDCSNPLLIFFSLFFSPFFSSFFSPFFSLFQSTMLSLEGKSKEVVEREFEEKIQSLLEEENFQGI